MKILRFLPLLLAGCSEAPKPTVDLTPIADAMNFRGISMVLVAAHCLSTILTVLGTLLVVLILLHILRR